MASNAPIIKPQQQFLHIDKPAPVLRDLWKLYLSNDDDDYYYYFNEFLSSSSEKDDFAYWFLYSFPLSNGNNHAFCRISDIVEHEITEDFDRSSNLLNIWGIEKLFYFHWSELCNTEQTFSIEMLRINQMRVINIVKPQKFMLLSKRMFIFIQLHIISLIKSIEMISIFFWLERQASLEFFCSSRIKGGSHYMIFILPICVKSSSDIFHFDIVLKWSFSMLIFYFESIFVLDITSNQCEVE